MKRTPPPLAMSYLLRVSSVVDDHEGKHKTRFILETSQSFASFVYDLSVQEQRERNHLRFKVLGLKPPQLSIPSAGRAKFERDYEDLAGTVDVTIESIDGSTNSFKFRISTGRVELVQAPVDTFIEIIL
jgi:hypothetical protein